MAKGKSSFNIKKQLALAMIIACSFIFSSTAVVLFFGMLPTIAAYFYDRSKEKLTAFTVGAMNLAGCFPFILELWMGQSHSAEDGLGKLTEYRAPLVIYMAAAIGWMIDWAMTGIIASLMEQKGKSRMQDIEKIQKAMIIRWGKEVTGTVQLDSDGYPLYPDNQKKGEQE